MNKVFFLTVSLFFALVIILSVCGCSSKMNGDFKYYDTIEKAIEDNDLGEKIYVLEGDYSYLVFYEEEKYTFLPLFFLKTEKGVKLSDEYETKVIKTSEIYQSKTGIFSANVTEVKNGKNSEYYSIVQLTYINEQIEVYDSNNTAYEQIIIHIFENGEDIVGNPYEFKSNVTILYGHIEEYKDTYSVVVDDYELLWK